MEDIEEIKTRIKDRISKIEDPEKLRIMESLLISILILWEKKLFSDSGNKLSISEYAAEFMSEHGYHY